MRLPSATARFKNGHFTMIGMEVDGRPLLRAYSIASANHEHSLRLVKSYEERLENLESLGEPTGKHPLSSLVRLTEAARINKAKGSVEGSKKAMGYVKDRLNST